MRIITNSDSYLASEWRAIRLATTLLIVILSLTFLAGSLFSGIRPSCCAVALGSSCSSCGITRSIAALLNGDFQGSVAFHNGGVWFVTLIAISLALRPISFLWQSPSVILIDLVAFVVAWIVFACLFFGVPGSGYHKKDAEQGASCNHYQPFSFDVSRNYNPHLSIDARRRW